MFFTEFVAQVANRRWARALERASVETPRARHRLVAQLRALAHASQIQDVHALFGVAAELMFAREGARKDLLRLAATGAQVGAGSVGARDAAIRRLDGVDATYRATEWIAQCVAAAGEREGWIMPVVVTNAARAEARLVLSMGVPCSCATRLDASRLDAARGDEERASDQPSEKMSNLEAEGEVTETEAAR